MGEYEFLKLRRSGPWELLSIHRTLVPESRMPEGGREVLRAWESDLSGQAASTTCCVFSSKWLVLSVCFCIYKIRGNNNDTYLAGLLGGFNGTIPLWPHKPQVPDEG